MRKDWKYIVYVASAVILFVTIKLLSPQQYDWTVTLAHDDKDPYGTFALDELMPGIFSEQHIQNSYRTLYEMKDSLQPKENIVIITSRFSCDKPDTDVLLAHVARGGTALISAQYFWGHLADTLNLGTHDYFFADGDILKKNDSAYLQLANHHLDTAERFWYKRDNIHNCFERFDTTRTTVVARNDYGYPVTLRMVWGEGHLILNSTPLVFTNIYLLANNNAGFVSATLSCLPGNDIRWTEFYHLGRREAKTPLRFVLTNEPLAWAYYIVIGSILLFMLFEAKRRQRIIPVIKPPANTSLEFVSTIGNLYYQGGDHKNMAEKKINFLLEQIRTRYLLKTTQFNDEFIGALAAKSGHSKEQVEALFRTISFIMSSTMISADQLVDLNEKVEEFYGRGENTTTQRR
jgi:hypothetical protein